ncbi:MAG: transposase [Candidatus Uhrbacteria bacterium]
MSRPLRIEYPGALYHVTSRGNEKKPIFRRDSDRAAFLQILADVSNVHNLVVYAYCLMGNHYHLLVETVDGNLSVAMRDLNGAYSQRFNKVHGRVGHLLQGRYKAFLVEEDAYLAEVARYVVLNPVRAGMVGVPGRWKWSSYRATAGTATAPPWLRIESVLGLFGPDVTAARKRYCEFVRKGIGEASPFDDVEEGMILGSKPFVDWVYGQSEGREGVREFPRGERIVGRPSLATVFDGVVGRIERNGAIVFARERCGYLLSEIARHLGLDPSSVGKVVRRNFGSTA